MFKEPKQEIGPEKRPEKEPSEAPSRFDYYKLMSGIIGRTEELMSQKKDLAGERIVELLVNDPRNEVKPNAEQIEIIKKMVQRYEDAKFDVLSYTNELIEKFKINKKEIPKNPLELLEKNPDVKLQLLYDLGLKSPDAAQFKIHIVFPTAIGIECFKLDDYATACGWTASEAATTRGMFVATDFAKSLADDSDKKRASKLNHNIYFLNRTAYPSTLLEKIFKKVTPIGMDKTITHEIQHHLFARYFDNSRWAEISHALEEISWQLAALPRPESVRVSAGEAGKEQIIQEIEKERQSLIEREAALKKSLGEIPTSKYIEKIALDEFSAYLKAGVYRYKKNSLFGREYYSLVENPRGDDLTSLRIKFDALKRQLWRLEAGGVDPKSLYKIFVATSGFDNVTEQLSKTDAKISVNGLVELLNDESDVELIFWLRDYLKERNRSVKSELIEKWAEGSMRREILGKDADKIGRSDLTLADKYIIRTESVAGRLSPKLKNLRDSIGGKYLENIYNRGKIIDPILASAMKEARYNPYTGEKIENISDRIAFAEDVAVELRGIWEKFITIIQEIRRYDWEAANALTKEMYDIKDGHRLTAREKMEEAEEELKDLKKVWGKLTETVAEIYKLDKDKGYYLASRERDERGNVLSVRKRYKEALQTLEQLKQK